MGSVVLHGLCYIYYYAECDYSESSVTCGIMPSVIIGSVIHYVNDMMMLHVTSLSLSYHYVEQTCQ
jgi:hypothetical protein